MSTLICIDGDSERLASLEDALRSFGHETTAVRELREAYYLLERHRADMVLADLDALAPEADVAIERMQALDPDLPVVLIVEPGRGREFLTREGVDRIERPASADALRFVIEHALRTARLRRENRDYRERLARLESAPAVVGRSPALLEALATLDAVAPTPVPVLIEGEWGTGKTLFARALHARSARAGGPFVELSCAAHSSTQLERELFGYERGAFAGAAERRIGALERAHGGTLLISEIPELRLDQQARLLRALRDQEFERLGGDYTIRADVRVVATTSLSLPVEVSAGGFRGDLYEHFQSATIHLPPLRERPEDVERLARHFAAKTAGQVGVREPELLPETLAALARHDWPGNVRELESAIARAVSLSRAATLAPGDVLPFRSDAAVMAHVRPPLSTVSAGPSAADAFNLESIRWATIQRALRATQGNRVKAAKLLGITDRTLRNLLNRPRNRARHSG